MAKNVNMTVELRLGQEGHELLRALEQFRADLDRLGRVGQSWCSPSPGNAGGIESHRCTCGQVCGLCPVHGVPYRVQHTTISSSFPRDIKEAQAPRGDAGSRGPCPVHSSPGECRPAFESSVAARLERLESVEAELKAALAWSSGVCRGLGLVSLGVGDAGVSVQDVVGRFRKMEEELERHRKNLVTPGDNAMPSSAKKLIEELDRLNRALRLAEDLRVEAEARADKLQQQGQAVHARLTESQEAHQLARKDAERHRKQADELNEQADELNLRLQEEKKRADYWADRFNAVSDGMTEVRKAVAQHAASITGRLERFQRVGIEDPAAGTCECEPAPGHKQLVQRNGRWICSRCLKEVQ